MLRNKTNSMIPMVINIKKPNKPCPRSQSVINQSIPRNKTIMNYVEMRLTKKEMKQIDHQPSGSSTSFASSIIDNNNNNHAATMKQVISPYLASMGIPMKREKSFKMIAKEQSRNNNNPLSLKVQNERLLERIMILTKENNDLRLENMKYKKIFMQINHQDHGQKSVDCDINTLSSKSNYD